MALSQPKTAQLTDIVVEHAQKCATTLFIIDDIHYLDMNRESAREVNDHLKMLMNETSATFIYAGVECSHTKLLTEGQPETKKHLGQTRRRFARMPLEPFKLKTPEQRQEWQRLLNSLEKLFVLRSMEIGVLGAPEMAQYLHDRTDGFIGSLVWLLRYAAGEAIDTGEEKFTRKLLDKVKIDDAAEKDYEAKQVRRSDSG